MQFYKKRRPHSSCVPLPWQFYNSLFPALLAAEQVCHSQRNGHGRRDFMILWLSRKITVISPCTLELESCALRPKPVGHISLWTAQRTVTMDREVDGHHNLWIWCAVLEAMDCVRFGKNRKVHTDGYRARTNISPLISHELPRLLSLPALQPQGAPEPTTKAQRSF